MNPLDNKAFLDACRTLIDKECAADATLRRQLKKPWTVKRLAEWVLWAISLLVSSAVFIVFCAVPAIICWRYPFEQLDVLCLCGMTLATTWCIIFIAVRMSISGSAFPLPSVFCYVPIHPDDVRTWTRKALLKQPPWVFCLILFLLLCSLAYRCGALGWTTLLLICGLSLLCALSGWAVASWLGRWLLGPWIFLIGGIIISVVIVTCCNSKDANLWVAAQIARYGEVFALLTPGGWAVGAFAASVHALSPNWWYALIPLAGLSVSLPFVLRNLDRHCSLEKFLEAGLVYDDDKIEEGGAQRPRCAEEGSAQRPRCAGEGSAQRPRCAEEGMAKTPCATTTVDMDDIRRHWAFSCATSRIGWLERLCIRCFSTQEKVTLEHLTLCFPRWTPWTLYALGAVVISVLPVAFAFRNDITVIQPWIFLGCSLAILFLFAITLPSLTGLTMSYGIRWTAYAYPFSLRDLFRMGQKAALVRSILAVPVYLAIGYVFTRALDAPLHQGIWISVKVLLMITLGLPCIPFYLNYHLSLSSFLIGIIFIGLFIALAILSFRTPPLLSCVCVLLFITCCRYWQSTVITLHDRRNYDL